MSRYAKVDRRVWNDERFRAFSDDGRYLWLALLTHLHLTSLGTLRSTWAGLAAELGWSERRLRAAAGPLVEAGMVDVNEAACYLGLRNFLRYNQPESPNVCKAWVAALELVPECEERRRLIARCEEALAELPESFRKAFAEAYRKTFGKPSGKPSESPAGRLPEDLGESVAVAVAVTVDTPPTPPTPRKRGALDARPWVECLNRETGSDFKATTTSNLRPILARIREGYTLEDAETVVKFKAREWTGTRWAAYLCPSTLFSEKFDGYLQAALKSNNGHDVNAAWKDEASGEVPLP
jgi:uncharacterized phage protein (TIGR02220 family)